MEDDLERRDAKSLRPDAAFSAEGIVEHLLQRVLRDQRQTHTVGERTCDRGLAGAWRSRHDHEARQVRTGHLALGCAVSNSGGVAELPLDRGDVVSIMESLLDVNWKLDRILAFLEDVDEEEEEEE